MGRLPEAWIAPVEIRELRELRRYRLKLVQRRSGVKEQVHAVLATLGIPVTCSDIFGVEGNRWLEELPLPQPYAGKVASLRTLIAALGTEITLLDVVIAGLLAGHDGYHALRALPGHRAGAGRGDRGRDRRHHPVPRPRTPMFAGGPDPAAPRNRCQGGPRSHHHARLTDPAVGQE